MLVMTFSLISSDGGIVLHLGIEESKEYVIEEPVPNDPGANAPRVDKDKFKKHMEDMLGVGCLILATITPELQKQHEDMVAYEMIQNLKEIYEGKAHQERYKTSKALFQYKMSEGSPVGAHVIKLIGYIQTSKKLDPFVFEQFDVCESCFLGKMTKDPFNGKGERASDLLGLIHSDVCGPMNTQARGGFQYFITFIDDFSRYGYIYLMRHKSEAL
ncbi:hypothetical protein GQ457_14G014530 [Hibiscus cannabinus]